MKPDGKVTRQRYDRLAPFFDLLEAPMEGLFLRTWRELLWRKVSGYHILEVGVGTGKNFDFYPQNARITAIDFSPNMLKQAELTKARKGVTVELALMDVQSLAYADNSFDAVVSTCVFCSVPQPSKGLKELYRVCKPGGQVLLLEHVLSANPLIAKLMNFFNPLAVRLTGANINRETVKNVQACGFSSVRVDKESGDIFKLIEALK
ncbi:MAG: methyltransferase domain-containing protein [Gammaproteobacteria bacterium]|nr:methyltransferase domain-containing protein [Gammaproteobacteria bacterium]